ncbi:MAG: DUF465 domain-containing protein [Desulfobacteraceae bacterium 4572_35.1]|nr:MAG: DUF465 domain-containing protein [Desulfobacteraceae bacterium 4572_35.1]
MDLNQDVVGELCEKDARFRKLYEEHRLLDKQLQRLDEISFLTAEQELERKTIQKMKLAAKDEMKEMVAAL